MKRFLETTIIIACVVGLIVLIALIVEGYIFNWDWTGLSGFNGISVATEVATTPQKITRTIVYQVYQPGKTLWYWLQLLIIPLALAVIAIFFNRSERKNEQKIASDNQQEAALQEYLKEMSELLLHEKLRESGEDDEVRKIARVRTLTVLPRLDGKRKRNLLLFLYDADLINRRGQIINVSDADFSEADLSEVNLFRYKWVRKGESHTFTTVKADLSGVNLRNANLNRANLRGVKLGAEDELHLEISDKDYSTQGTIRADLSRADLRGADLSIQTLIEELDDSEGPPDTSELSKADLSGANLSGANLRGANLSGAIGTTPEQLIKAKSLKGATMPDGSIHS